MYRSTSIMFTFFFQYLILDIEPNLLKLSGAGFITLGIVMVMGYKMVDTREREKPENIKEAGNVDAGYGCFRKLFFLKF